MKYAIAIGLCLGLCSCGALAGLFGYIPAEDVPGSEGGVVDAVLKTAGLTDASVPLAVGITYFLRNLTAVSRAKAVLKKIAKTEAPKA